MRTDGKKLFSKNLIPVSLASMFNDIASDMIYPLIPLFLSAVSGVQTTFILGIIEGIAETVAAIGKYWFGELSDRARSKKPFAITGYTLSNASRPLMALASNWWTLFIFRFLDRVGKGIRTAPRDAILSGSTPRENRGFAFSFHRAMDNLGAVIGPLAASLILLIFAKDPHYPCIVDYQAVFWLSLAPGLISVLIFVFFVKEDRSGHDPRSRPSAGKTPVRKDLRIFFAALFIFTLGNSSDAFLILRAKEAGISVILIPVLWSFFHLFKISISPLFGKLSDRIGRVKPMIAGWILYCAVYFIFSLNLSAIMVWVIFAVYGIYFALTEGVEKALVADLAPKEAHGKAFGLYNGITGITKLPASILFGLLWRYFNYRIAFLTGAFFSLAAVIFFLLLFRRKTDER